MAKKKKSKNKSFMKVGKTYDIPDFAKRVEVNPDGVLFLDETTCIGICDDKSGALSFLNNRYDPDLVEKFNVGFLKKLFKMSGACDEDHVLIYVDSKKKKALPCVLKNSILAPVIDDWCWGW